MIIELKDLPPLETYRSERLKERERANEARAARRLNIGQHIVLLFENRATMYYQIMEMLHIENKDSQNAREEELNAYNPLISDANNLKATMQIEYTEEQERAEKLAILKDIEQHMWYRFGDAEPVYAIPDEDIRRSDENKTSAVHFLRYPIDVAKLSQSMDSNWVFGCDHTHYRFDSGILAIDVRKALLEDLQLKSST